MGMVVGVEITNETETSLCEGCNNEFPDEDLEWYDDPHGRWPGFYCEECHPICYCRDCDPDFWNDLNRDR